MELKSERMVEGGLASPGSERDRQKKEIEPPLARVKCSRGSGGGPWSGVEGEDSMVNHLERSSAVPLTVVPNRHPMQVLLVTENILSNRNKSFLVN